MSLKLSIEQKVSLSQNQIQSLKILEFDIFELNDFLQIEYLENPFLEYRNNNTTYFNEKDFFDIATNLPAEEPDKWKNELIEQLNFLEFNKTEWTIIMFLIDCLDDNGYFSMEISEVAEILHCKEDSVRRCLTVLSSLEPVGIFSANITECLLKQINYFDNVDENLKKIIQFHLEDLASGYIKRISRDLHITTMQVLNYEKVIKELDPKPLKGLIKKNVNYIIPDIIIESKNNKWEIVLNDNWVGNYSINEHYIKIMKESDDDEIKNYFKNLLNRSYFIIKSIEQRRLTLMKITESIIEKQKSFFEGKKELEPMSMLEISEKIGVNVSTVSRAIKNKYIQTNIGTLEMRSLFTSVVSKTEDLVVNADYVKEELKNLIRGEKHSSPYSDNQIACILSNKGINIARRTVTKYREELRIPKASERKL